MQPTPRSSLYETYWKFASERQSVFHKRLRREPGPWTDDPILKRFKFCNAYRASDRVSQYLIRQVIYSDVARDLSPEDKFFRVILFRFFSRESTWQALEEKACPVSIRTFDVSAFGEILDYLKAKQSIYTSAFILSAHSAYGFAEKHRNHLALLDEMFRQGRLSRSLARARSLRDVYEALLPWPMIGPFLAYQIAIDLNYTEEINFSEDDFTMPGPGALRGLRKVFADFGGLEPQAIVQLMVAKQDEEFDRLGIAFDDLFGRRLHAIDCQGLFCEVDKYSRVAFPELKSERVRIKHQFNPTAEPIELFYPPKWGLNDRLRVEVDGRIPTPTIVSLR